MKPTLLDELRKGDRLALSRLLTQVERDTPSGRAALEELFPATGHAHKIGITGPPGSGKSTLVNALVYALRSLENDPKVAVVAVDPTSPFSGGAILGDRVRMLESQSDPKVFIRSMASRGALGGLAERTAAVTQVFDAAGYDFVIIETVGAGQSEVDIVRLAHTTIVVDIPGTGDDIQSIKAGILEIADILVVNKSDHPGADATLRNLSTMVAMGQRRQYSATKHGPSLSTPKAETEAEPAWYVPVLKTIAAEKTGIERLADAILRHGAYLRESGMWEQKEAAALRETIIKMLASTLLKNWRARVPDEELEAILAKVSARNISPQEAVERLLAL